MYEERLLNEAQVLRQLDHPSIIGFRSVVRSNDGGLCLFMEDGKKSLQSLIEEREETDLKSFPSVNIEKVCIKLLINY